MSDSVQPLIRVAVLQPAVPHYRLGLFDLVAAHAAIEMTVHGSASDGLGVRTVQPLPSWGRIHGETRVLRPFGRILRWHPGQIAALFRSSPNVVVLHGAASNLTSLVAVLICRLRGIPVVWWTHGGHDVRLSRPAVLLRLLLARLSGGLLLYTSEEAVQYCRFRLLRNRPVIGLDNGVEYQAIRNALAAVDAGEVASIRGRLPASTSLRVLFCGRFTAKADLPLLISALERCHSSIGAVLIGDGEFLDAMIVRAQSLLASGRLVLAGRVVGPAALSPYFAASDVFVYPGDMGLSGIEALAFGLPVVTHDHEPSQMPETAALKEGFNSLRFRHRDADDLAAMLNRLDDDRALLAMLAANAPTIVAERFDIERSAARFVECVRAVAALRPAR